MKGRARQNAGMEKGSWGTWEARNGTLNVAGRNKMDDRGKMHRHDMSDLHKKERQVQKRGVRKLNWFVKRR